MRRRPTSSARRSCTGRSTVLVGDRAFSRIATMLEGVRVDFYGAHPPESAVENFRRAGSEIGIKPTHLAGFTRGLAPICREPAIPVQPGPEGNKTLALDVGI